MCYGPDATGLDALKLGKTMEEMDGSTAGASFYYHLSRDH
jgi:hypothetical protein